MQIIERPSRGKALAKANLKPVRRTKQGREYWVARGTAPLWSARRGCFVTSRLERRLCGDTPTARKAEVDRLNRALDAEAEHAVAPITFARAYTNYIETNGAVPLYWQKLLDGLGGRQCRTIDDTVMVELRRAIFKPDAAASYINRHLYTPVIAILAMALGRDAPRLTRPRGHKDRALDTHIKIPPPDWYGRITAHLDADSAALVYFLVVHGRRLGDALNRSPADFDATYGTLTVGRTKNGDPLLIRLQADVAAMIRALPGWQSRHRLFGDANPSRFRQRVMDACKRAGAEYYTPHEFGRHSFATRMLRAGFSLQYVKDAGGWKSIEIVSRLYGHLERKEWQDGVNRVALDLFPSNAGATSGRWIEHEASDPQKT